MKQKYDNRDKGVLFPNDDKKGETHPDFKGSINVEGVDYWISGWKNQSKAGNKYMSLSVKRKDERQATKAEQPPPADFDDAIPW